MKIPIILIVLLFQSFVSKAQFVTLGMDTITFYEGLRIDIQTKQQTSYFKTFSIKSLLYDGSNFPFQYSNCEGERNNQLQLQDYNPIIDSKSIKKLLKVLNNKASKYLKENFDKDEMTSFNTCLLNNYKDSKLAFVVRKQRFVAVYLIIDCKIGKGCCGPGFFCEELIELNKVPVILKVEKLLD